MVAEQDLQTNILRFLRSHGCVALKVPASPGVPKGFPDILALKEGVWIALEVKKSKTAKFQTGQPQLIKKLNEWSYAKAVYPQNWPQIKEELEEWLK